MQCLKLSCTKFIICQEDTYSRLFTKKFALCYSLPLSICLITAFTPLTLRRLLSELMCLRAVRVGFHTTPTHSETPPLHTRHQLPKRPAEETSIHSCTSTFQSQILQQCRHSTLGKLSHSENRSCFSV